jgi:hypothetical protein
MRFATRVPILERGGLPPLPISLSKIQSAWIVLLSFLLCGLSPKADDWQTAFSKIPIRATKFSSHLTPPVELILTNFQPTTEIRAIVLMPGAADHLYFYDWGEVTLPANPTLLDAITALTNKADLRIFAAPPFLLIGMQYDNPVDPLAIDSDTSIDKLKLNTRKKPGRAYYLDCPYDRLVRDAEKLTHLRLKPSRSDPASWHYYRLSFVGYDLTAAEFLRVIAYGTKTSVHIQKRRAIFVERPFVQ